MEDIKCLYVIIEECHGWHGETHSKIIGIYSDYKQAGNAATRYQDAWNALEEIHETPNDIDYVRFTVDMFVDVTGNHEVWKDDV